MSNRNANSDNPLTIPRLVAPRHRFSIIGFLGATTRSLTSALRGPKGVLLGISLALAVIAAEQHITQQSAQKGSIQSTSDSAQPQSITQSDAQANIPQVTLHTAQLATVERKLTLTGTVIPENLLRITPPLDGLKVTEMMVQPGDAIAAGQPIATLDDRILRSQIAQAQAQLAQAESEIRAQEAAIAQAKVLEQAALTDVQRYSTLYQQGAVSQEQLGERQVDTFSAQQNVETALALRGNAQAKVASQLATIDQIKTQLAQTVVLAPTAGVIAERHATLGETVSATTPLYSLIENNQLILTVTPSQSQLEQIALNAPVSIRSTSRANQLSLTGSVKSIDPILTENSRQATVKIALSGSPAALRSGMFLQANIQTSKGKGIVVPAAAVITQANGESIIYTVEKASNSLSSRQKNAPKNAQEIYTAIAHSVKTAPFSAVTNSQSQTSEQTQNYVQVLSGLSVGDRIITSGASYLQPGDRVTIAAPTAPPSTTP
ncbi:MAG: efflux RND transporter periplasmic adaptor subunit [Cyanobacteria bacterium J06614_10]